MTNKNAIQSKKNFKDLFEATFEHASVGMAHLSLEGELLRVNEALCSLLQYQSEALKAKSLDEISHPKDYEKEAEKLQKIVNGDIDQYTLEKRYVKSDLSTVWVEVNVTLIRDDNEEPKFLLGVIEDISERVKARNQSEKLSTIVELQQDVAISELEIDETIRRVSEAAAKAAESDGATVESAEGDELIYQGSTGILEDYIGLRVSVDDTAAGEAYKSEELINCHDIKTDDRMNYPGSDDSGDYRSALIVPLTYKEKTFGVLKVVSEKPYYFQEEDEKTLRLLSGLLASQIFHSLQYENTLLRSRTDELTGLFNRRGLMEELNREMERSSRYNHDLSLVMYDLDHFKLVNDTHGHVVGDQVLQTVGDILKSQTRDADIVGRYGGEEFMTLLPEVSAKDAKVLANRIRSELSENSFEGKDGKDFTVTASAGIANYDDSLSVKEYVDRADEALYEAKKNGRDQVCLYD